MTTKLWRVTVEKTFFADFVVAAVDLTAARSAARSCDPEDVDGDYETAVTGVGEILSAKDLPAGITVNDSIDAAAPDVRGHRIGDFLGPQESEEERAARAHNEAMQKLQGSLF